MSSIEIKNDSPAQPGGLSFQRTRHEEIDLLSILQVLFHSAKTVIFVTAVFAVLGATLALLMPQKWTSEAVISTAETPQLIELQRMFIQLQVLDVDTQIDAKYLESLFLKKFDSRSMQEAFLRSSPWVQVQLSKAQGDTASLQRAIANVAQRFKMQSNDNPKIASPYSSWTLSFTAPKAQDAQRVLSDYINYVSLAVQKEVIANLRSAVDLKSRVEESRLALERNNLVNQHNIAIQRLHYSLEVANAAGIKKPVYSNGQAVKDDPDYSIALGADGLAQKLEIERSIKDVSELNAAIQNREYRLAELKKLNVEETDFTPVNFQMSASLPMKNDGPGKLIVLVMATLAGLIVACGIVLLRDAMAQRVMREPAILP
ncbi:LPS O-antigen length regulator Wzz(fepE) [Franconibacter pulveris]